MCKESYKNGGRDRLRVKGNVKIKKIGGLFIPIRITKEIRKIKYSGQREP